MEKKVLEKSVVIYLFVNLYGQALLKPVRKD